MTASSGTPKSKTLATWLALLGGSLGLHRFYLHGRRDLFGWLHPLPTLIGLYGIQRALVFGQDDGLSWALIPLLGIALASSMLAAIVYGLTSNEKWNARFNPLAPQADSGWLAMSASWRGAPTVRHKTMSGAGGHRVWKSRMRRSPGSQRTRRCWIGGVDRFANSRGPVMPRGARRRRWSWRRNNNSLDCA